MNHLLSGRPVRTLQGDPQVGFIGRTMDICSIFTFLTFNNELGGKMDSCVHRLPPCLLHAREIKQGGIFFLLLISMFSVASFQYVVGA